MSEADLILGAPWREHGRDRDGFDCYGVALWLGKIWATPLPDVSELVAELWSRRVTDAREFGGLPEGWQAIEIRAARQGDVVWMRNEMDANGLVDHLEIVEEPGYSITAVRNHGVVRRRWTRAWRDRVHEVWRAPCSA